MKVPRFCNLSDPMQGMIFIVLGVLIFLNTLNIRLMNLLLFIVALLLIFYGLVATGWLDRVIDLFNKAKKND